MDWSSNECRKPNDEGSQKSEVRSLPPSTIPPACFCALQFGRGFGRLRIVYRCIDKRRRQSADPPVTTVLGGRMWKTRRVLSNGKIDTQKSRPGFNRSDPHGEALARANIPSTDRLAERAKSEGCSEGRQELVDLDKGQFPAWVGRCGMALPVGVRLIDPVVFRRRGARRRRAP